MGRLDDVLGAVKDAVESALFAANVTPPGKVVVMWPDVQGDILPALAAGYGIVAVQPIDGGRIDNRYRPEDLDPTGTSPVFSTTVGRTIQFAQIALWAPTDALRSAILDAITAAIGTELTQWLTLADGTSVHLVLLSPPRLADERVESSNAKRADVRMSLEYDLISSQPATTIAVATADLTPNGGTVIHITTT